MTWRKSSQSYAHGRERTERRTAKSRVDASDVIWPPDRDDRRRQLDARPRGGARAVARKVADALDADACFVYLYDERADELVLRATHGTGVEEMTRRPRMRPGEGITGSAAAERAPVMIPAQAHSTRASSRSRTCRRTTTSRSSPSRSSLEMADRGRAQRPHRRAARVHRARDRAAARDRRPGCAVDRARAALRRGAAPRPRAGGAGADLRGGVRVALPRGVARGDREDDDGRARRDRRRARARGREDRVAGGSRRRVRGSPAAALARPRDRRARLRPRHAVHGRRPAAARLDRAPRRGRARARPGGHARRARPGDPPPRQEQPADGRVAAAAAGARDRRRPAEGARGLGQPHPRDRGRPRGADGAARRRRRAPGAARPPARDARAGTRRRKRGRGVLEPVSLAGARATALALVFWELLQNALEHGGRRARRARPPDGDVVLAIADDGEGIDGEPTAAPASRSFARSCATSSAGALA